MSVASVRQETAERLGTGTRCGSCGEQATSATLSSFGAMCFRCYCAYLRTPPPYPAHVELTPREADSPRAWAYRLQARQRRGEVLTPVQLEYMREGLREL